MSVIGIRMRDEECSFDRAAVRIGPFWCKYVLVVDVPVLVVYWPGKGYCYHLGCLKLEISEVPKY